MKILVLGGTGAMGKHLVDCLLNEHSDWEVYVTSRSQHLGTKNIKYIRINAMDMSQLHPVVEEKWDIIVDFIVRPNEQFENGFSLFLNSCSQYFFISSARVFSNHRLIAEQSDRLLDSSADLVYLKTNEYALEKAKAENVLFNSKCNNWVIIRPYITYDTYRLQFGTYEKEEWLFRALSGKTIAFDKELFEHETTLTYGLDVVKRMILLFGKKDVNGHSFNITSRQHLKWSDVFNIYSNALKTVGIDLKIKLVDGEAFKLHHNHYQYVYDRMFDRVFDPSLVEKTTGLVQYTQVEDGLSLCLHSFIENPLFKEINWLNEARQDKATREWTSLKKIKGLKNKLKYIFIRFGFKK